MPFIAVVLHLEILVGTAEPDPVRGDNTKASSQKRRDHPTVEEAPGWFPMQKEEWLPGRQTLIQVVHARTFEIQVVGREGEVRESFETLFRSANRRRGGHRYAGPAIRHSTPDGSI